MIDNGGPIVPNSAAAILAGKSTTLSSIYDTAAATTAASRAAAIIDQRHHHDGSPRYSPIKPLNNSNSSAPANCNITNNNNNNHSIRNFNASLCANVTTSGGTIPAIIISGRILNSDTTGEDISSSLPTYWHCNCASGGNYQETMPKDISPPPASNEAKVRSKYAAEFPIVQQIQQQQEGQPKNCPKQHKIKPRQMQRSRFRTMPITLEEFREADEELYIKQQKEAGKSEDDNDNEDAFSDDQEQPVGKFRQKAWTFTMGSSLTPSNKRSPSPNRKLGASRGWSPNLHITTTPNSRTTLNWRPLSQDSLLNLNNLSTLPTIPEERRLLNSPLTPSCDNNVVNQFGQQNENAEVVKSGQLQA